MVKINLKIILMFMIFLVLNFFVIADYFQISSQNSEIIDRHGVCREVRNGDIISGPQPTIFVPTKTSAEWSAFRTHAPNHIIFDDCFECDRDSDCDNIYSSCTRDMECKGGECCHTGRGQPSDCPPACS